MPSFPSGQNPEPDRPVDSIGGLENVHDLSSERLIDQPVFPREADPQTKTQKTKVSSETTEQKTSHRRSILEAFEKHRIVRSALFKPREFEKQGKIYRALGAHLFLKHIAPKGHWQVESKAELFSELLRFSVLNEVISTPFAVYGIGRSIISFASGDTLGGFIGAAVGLGMGVYPMMGARYQRARLFTLAERLAKKAS